MSSSFQKKSASIMATMFIGLVCFAFIFTGVEFGGQTGDTVAQVNGLPIKLDQYQRALARQTDFYKRMTRKENLTQKEIEQAGLQKQALNGLVDAKLMESLAEDMGYHPGKEELQEEIKNLPYFKTGGVFDVTLYKALLAQNNYSPSDFEQQIRGDLKVKRFAGLFNSIPFSKGYLKTYKELSTKSVIADVVLINRNELERRVPVTQKEIKDYLADDSNFKRLEGLFLSRKSSLDKPEEIKASHILFKVDQQKNNEEDIKKKAEAAYKKLTTANFASMANKLTEDPSGKGKGGSLGWFRKGRMVPAFEKQAFTQKPGTISKPIKTSFGYHIIYVQSKKAAKVAKFSDHKERLAKEEIQMTKKDEVDTLAQKLKKDATQALANNELSKLTPLKKKFNIIVNKDVSVKLIDGNIPGAYLKDGDLAKIFDQTKFKQVQTFSETHKTTLVYVKEMKSVADPSSKETSPKELAKRDLQAQQYTYRTKLRAELLKNAKEKANITIDDRLL